MKNLYAFLICLLTASLQAAPSFADLDSWQLPDPEPVAKPTVAPKQTTTQPRPRSTGSEEKEIRVEMSGSSYYTAATSTQDPNEIPIFRLSAAQLAKKLAGKSRFYVLFNANVVATKDSIIRDADNTRYALVRFGKEGDPYRIFLFEGEGDQRLLSVAQDVPGVLSINTRYGVIINVREKDFKKAYPKTTWNVFQNKQENKEYHFYRNAPSLFLIFGDGNLLKQFPTASDAVLYLQSIGAVDTETAARQAKEQAEIEKIRQQHEKHRLERERRPPFKALVEGGTVEDQMYLPHVTNPEDYNGADLPPLTPSGPKAGTPLIRDVDGKYMNNR